MAVNRIRFEAGLLIYVVSFFLVAAEGRKWWIGSMRGYVCAYQVVESVATSSPFSSPDSPDYAHPLLYLCFVVIALINPVFLAYVTLALLKRKPRIVTALKFAVLPMIPFCWVVFHAFELYPREGHVLWVTGMLLVVFSGWKQVPKPVTEVGAVS